MVPLLSRCSANAQVSQKQMLADLSTPKFEWDHPSMQQSSSASIEKQVCQACMLSG